MSETKQILKSNQNRFSPTVSQELKEYNMLKDREYEEWLDQYHFNDDYDNNQQDYYNVRY